MSGCSVRLVVSFRPSMAVPITEPIRQAIVHASAWIPALDAEGDLRDGAQVVELTHLVAADVLAA